MATLEGSRRLDPPALFWGALSAICPAVLKAIMKIKKNPGARARIGPSPTSPQKHKAVRTHPRDPPGEGAKTKHKNNVKHSHYVWRGSDGITKAQALIAHGSPTLGHHSCECNQCQANLPAIPSPHPHATPSHSYVNSSYCIDICINIYTYTHICVYMYSVSSAGEREVRSTEAGLWNSR
jgi:hypothetical protein